MRIRFNCKIRVIALTLLCLSMYLFAQPEGSLTLTFLGDLMAHDVNFRVKDFSAAFADVADILANDDCTFVNLEAPVNEKEPFHTYPSFNMRREYVKAALNAGIDAMSLANNHSYDRGYEGIVQTISSMIMLKEKNGGRMYFSGIRVDTGKPFKPVSIKKKGWRIGFISVTQFLNTLVKRDYVHIVDYRNTAESDAFVKLVKAASVDYDLFIVSYHGDAEYSLAPDPLKVLFFKRLIEAGCHIVYGHHPHVLQPYETVEAGGKKGLAIYSMGNFLSGQRWSLIPYEVQNIRSYTGDSVILQVLVEYRRGSPEIELRKPIIITNHINERREVVVKLLDHLTDEKNNNERLDETWKAYYNQRLAIMKDFLSGFSVNEKKKAP